MSNDGREYFAFSKLIYSLKPLTYYKLTLRMILGFITRHYQCPSSYHNTNIYIPTQEMLSTETVYS